MSSPSSSDNEHTALLVGINEPLYQSDRELNRSMTLNNLFATFDTARKGQQTVADWSSRDLPEIHPENHQVLGQWRATSIAGNDITSSIFYTIGICATTAGRYTPFAMTLVVLMLYLFRSIYSEVCTALPLNGGTYNVLLNVTTKGVASVAAALSLLSYMVTSVVSANSGASYLFGVYQLIWGKMDHHELHYWIFYTTIIILGIFALLNLLGISESANVALAIFFFHLFTLFLLVVFGSIEAIETGFKGIKENWDSPQRYGVGLALYYGFSSSLLGVSGFESSSNYIEEQKDGVFPKTLRNMWGALMFFNPLLSVIAVTVLTLSGIVENSDQVLINMAGATRYGKHWLPYMVGIDACIVLCGAVLTSYVGVIGLVKRMAMDRVMPGFLMHENRFRGTCHWIIGGFFALTTSLMFITNGDLDVLGGVYTTAFLCVMALFAIGNLLMKYKRKQLPRAETANWLTVISGLVLVVAGLIGNIIYNPDIVLYFFIYFSVVMAIISIMFTRIRILKISLFFIRKSPFLARFLGVWATNLSKQIKKQQVVFFTKNSDPALINKAILYVLENEITENLTIIHVYSSDDDLPKDLVTTISFIDPLYPKLAIDLLLIKHPLGFCPAIIEELTRETGVAKNMMFVACPGKKLSHKLSDFGGLRIITH